MKAYVLIQTESHGQPVAHSLMSIPGILAADDLSGAYDAIALAHAVSSRHLMDKIIATIKAIPGVSRALPSPVLSSWPGVPAGDEPVSAASASQAA
jgi:hypothetical protein